MTLSAQVETVGDRIIKSPWWDVDRHGMPDRPSIDNEQAWGIIRKVDETGDWSILPVLADAMEDRARVSAVVLAHLRYHPHVSRPHHPAGGCWLGRCWVLDWFLDRYPLALAVPATELGVASWCVHISSKELLFRGFGFLPGSAKRTQYAARRSGEWVVRGFRSRVLLTRQYPDPADPVHFLVCPGGADDTEDMVVNSHLGADLKISDPEPYRIRGGCGQEYTCCFTDDNQPYLANVLTSRRLPSSFRASLLAPHHGITPQRVLFE